MSDAPNLPSQPPETPGPPVQPVPLQPAYGVWPNASVPQVLYLPPPRPLTWDHPAFLVAFLAFAVELSAILGVQLLVKLWRPWFAIGEVVAWLIPALIYARVARLGWGGAFRLRWTVAIGLAFVAVTAVCVAVVNGMVGSWLEENVLREAEDPNNPLLQLMKCKTPWQWVWATLGIAVAAPFGEELAFRGIIQRGLARRWGPWPALFITSGAFALIHMQLVALPLLFLLGLVCGWLYMASGSLWPSILLHGAYNFTILWLANGRPVGPVNPENVTGQTLLIAFCAALVALVLFGLIAHQWKRRPNPAGTG